MKLYELSIAYNNFLEMCENEEIEADFVTDTLESITDEFEDKILSLAKVFKTIEAQEKVIKEEEKRLSNKRKTLENKKKFIKSYMEENMKNLGMSKVAGDIIKVSIQQNAPSVNVLNLQSIPEKYFKTIDPQLDKKMVLKDLKEGNDVLGCELKRTKTLRIR